MMLPVLAADGAITIGYRGSGGSYIGETVVFDGRNTYGNTTLLAITGPGLPPSGVPVNNLNGPAGTGTPVEVDQNGAWKFAWYASAVPGIERLNTARYTFIATDKANPEKSSTTFFMLKKPEYSITARPDPVSPGHYLELIGSAEQGITTAKIEIADSSGAVLHSFTSPVSSSGYFSYGLHVDMAPGRYRATVTSPELPVPFSTTFSVVPEEGTPASPPAVTGTPAAPPATTTETAGMTAEAVTSPQASVPAPTRSPLAPFGIFAAILAGVILAGSIRRP
jgi:hypothetical protein